MKSHIHATGLFLIHQHSFLLLRRNPQDPQASQWGLVGGQVEPDELPLQAVLREVEAEIDLKLEAAQIQLLDQFELTYPEYDVTFYVFSTTVDQAFDPFMDQAEHLDFRWVTRDQCLQLANVISGLQIILHSPAIKQALEATV